MAANASSLSAPWSDRIKRPAIILLVTALVLGGLVVLTDLTLPRAIFAFVCIAAAALVPWQLHDGSLAQGYAAAHRSGGRRGGRAR